MMKNYILVGTLVASVFFIASGIGFAEKGAELPVRINPRSATLPLKTAPAIKPVLIAKPLVTEIKANPALIRESVKTLTVPFEELSAAMDRVKLKYGSWNYINGVPDWIQNHCAGKSYTIDEQKEAGCLGTDTVDECSKKLYWNCFQDSPYLQSYKSRLKEMVEAMDALNRAAVLYENGLKTAEKKIEQP